MKIKNRKKGFTLAELLVVVAIIAVLVAVSIPIFNAQLGKARLATNQANARAAKAATIAEYLTDSTIVGGEYDVATGVLTVVKTGGTVTTGTISVTGEPSTWTTANESLTKATYTTTIGVTLDTAPGKEGTVKQYDLK